MEPDILSDPANLAACHACVLLSENSCRHFNQYLDRAPCRYARTPGGRVLSLQVSITSRSPDESGMSVEVEALEEALEFGGARRPP